MPLYLTAAQVALGAGQSIFSGKNERQADYENYLKRNPQYTGGNSINDYYNKALARYNVNPYSSPLYAMQTQNANRATNQALASLGDRRAGIGSIGKLTGIQDDATLKAGITAEADQARRLSQLGGAANALTQNQKYAYQVNQLNPYLRQLQQKQQAFSGASNVYNAGLSNIFGGLSSGAVMANSNAQLAKKIAAGIGGNNETNGSTIGTTAKVDANNVDLTADPYLGSNDTDPYAVDNGRPQQNTQLSDFYRYLNKRTKFGMGGGN